MYGGVESPASKARRRGGASERQIANDSPMPVGLALPDRQVRASAAHRGRAVALGRQLDPAAAPLGDARWPEDGQSRLHHATGADRPQTREALGVHAGDRGPPPGDRAVAGDEQPAVRVRGRDGARVAPLQTREPGGVRGIDLGPSAREDRGGVERRASRVRGRRAPGYLRRQGRPNQQRARKHSERRDATDPGWRSHVSVSTPPRWSIAPTATTSEVVARYGGGVDERSGRVEPQRTQSAPRTATVRTGFESLSCTRTHA